ASSPSWSARGSSRREGGAWWCMTPTRWRHMSSERRREERSAGGVVVRGEQALVIVPARRAADGSRVLGLPKGHIDPGETEQQAATREVREETGVQAEL